MWEKIRYAFQVAPAEPLGEEDVELLQRVAGRICRRGMSAPALLALESARPLSFLGSQVMVALKPFVEMLLPWRDYGRFAAILERRDGIVKLITCIEQAESERSNAE